ncbi:MAG TPA: hypothetical protein VN956_18745 [Pyrinomonadaceae bacterium]|nr:hypothetical protein [Pyrinomonadaceae bacterium]
MSDDNSTNGARSRFPSLASLKIVNNELLKRRRSEEDKPEYLEEVKAFIQKGRATGAVLNVDSDRWTGQDVLDYWANFLDRHDSLSSEIVLDPFDKTRAITLDESKRPYVGLEAFRESKYSLFFGRQSLIEKLSNRLETSRFLAVVGPSGSGKSSLVLAGLLPALKSGKVDKSERWQYLSTIVPGFDPLTSLASLLPTGGTKTAEVIREHVKGFKRSSGYLLQMVNQNNSEPALIIVDQFEEIFTLTSDETIRKAFINNLLALVNYPDLRHTVIITMRSDFKPYVTKMPELQPYFMASTEEVTDLTGVELREAIQGPADLRGLKFEEGIVDDLVTEAIKEPAGLPLLQFALLKLWDARENNLVTWKAFTKVGGVREALTRSADSFYTRQSPIDQARVKWILLRLVRPRAGLEVFSNRVARESLYKTAEEREHIDSVLDGLIGAGLVRETEGSLPGEVKVEVAHEILVRQWRRLVAWLDEERVGMRKRLVLTEAARQWDTSGRDPSALLRGALLDEALHYEDLNLQEDAFVQASLSRKRLTKTLRALTLAASFLGLVVLAFFLYYARSQALAAKSQALSRQLAAEAQRLKEDRPDLALLLSMEAYRILPTAAARNSLFSALQKIPHVRAYLRGADSPPTALGFNSGGSILISFTSKGSISTWDVNSQRLLSQSAIPEADQLKSSLFPSGALPTSSALSADARTLAVRTAEGAMILVDSANGQLLRQLDDKRGPKNQIIDSITAMVFSPDGKFLASVSPTDDQTVELWDVATGKLQPSLKIKERVGVLEWMTTSALAFSPNGKTLAAAVGYFDSEYNLHRDLVLLDVATGRQRSLGRSDGSSRRSPLVFSPDGKLVAAGEPDDSVTLWDVATSKSLISLTQNSRRKAQGDRYAEQEITSIAFSRDGKVLASGGRDGNLVVWNVEDSVKLHLAVRKGAFIAHSNSVSSLSFSPDSQTLASADMVGNIILWNIGNQGSLTRVLPACGSRSGSSWQRARPLPSIALSPNGKLLATGDSYGGIVFRDGITQECSEKNLPPPGEAQNQTNERPGLTRGWSVNSLAFTSDGKLMAHYRPGKGILWDVNNGQPLVELPHNEPGRIVNNMWISPDGKILVWGSQVGPSSEKVPIGSGRYQKETSEAHDVTLKLWSYASGQPHTIMENAPGASAVAFSPNSEILAVGGKGFSVTLWNVNALTEIATLPVPQPEDARSPAPSPSPSSPSLSEASQNRSMTSLAFSPDGRTLAGGSSDNSIILWDVDKRTLLDDPLVGHNAAVMKVTFDNDGKVLASSSVDGTVILWDVETRQALAEIPSGRGDPLDSVFSADGKYLFVATGFALPAVWDVSMDSWQQRACKIANRNLTKLEWRQYVGKDEPYHATCSNLPSEAGGAK